MNRISGSIRRQPSFRPSFAGVRRHPRCELRTQVFVQDAEGWEIPLESIDFCPTGMFVRSNFLFEPGQVHTLVFRSPAGESMYAVRARVVRAETGAEYGDRLPADFVPGMAYEFVDVAPRVRQRLFGLASQCAVQG
ncbi:hypothetical protein DL240_05385 [Lujinxingia litoralis]|uniref:PilZ domain-containing protein n=1 Tax=Lujinxingia litoralis TaxID=2211119 RepID=A0A328C6X7_9DELT|nr:PilZ domain-containing protein [Lujinxingia litoralis]RAL23593.1 hypothetical protein DL240_05385 [Lujinxingia litoralis]